MDATFTSASPATTRFRLRPSDLPQWIKTDVTWETREALRNEAKSSGVSVDVFVGLQLEVLAAREKFGELDSVFARLTTTPITLATDPKLRRWQHHLFSSRRGEDRRDELPELVVPQRLGLVPTLREEEVRSLLDLEWDKTRQLEVTAVGLNLRIDELAELLRLSQATSRKV